MESVLTYTLLADGPTDEAITRVIDWLLKDVAPSLTPAPQFADLRGLPRPPKLLHEQIETALRLHPFSLSTAMPRIRAPAPGGQRYRPPWTRSRPWANTSLSSRSG